jgi:hypothetical protein
MNEINNENNKDGNIKEFSNESMRNIAKEIILRRLSLFIHLTAYIFVNILLIIINLLTDPTYLWYLWSVTSWGIGILLHIFNYFAFKKGSFSSSGQSGLAYHIVIYVIVCSYLVFVNYFTLGLDNLWVLWAVIPWGFGVFFHLWLRGLNKPKRGEDPKNSWLERKIKKELGRIKEE